MAVKIEPLESRKEGSLVEEQLHIQCSSLGGCSGANSAHLRSLRFPRPP